MVTITSELHIFSSNPMKYFPYIVKNFKEKIGTESVERKATKIIKEYYILNNNFSIKNTLKRAPSTEAPIITTPPQKEHLYKHFLYFDEIIEQISVNIKTEEAKL